MLGVAAAVSQATGLLLLRVVLLLRHLQESLLEKNGALQGHDGGQIMYRLRHRLPMTPMAGALSQTAAGLPQLTVVAAGATVVVSRRDACTGTSTTSLCRRRACHARAQTQCLAEGRHLAAMSLQSPRPRLCAAHRAREVQQTVHVLGPLAQVVDEECRHMLCVSMQAQFRERAVAQRTQRCRFCGRRLDLTLIAGFVLSPLQRFVRGLVD